MSANEKEENKTNTTDKTVSKDDEIQKYNSFNYWKQDNYDQDDLPDLSSEEPIKVEIEQFDDFDEDDFNDDDEWGDDDNNNNNNGDGDEDDYEDDYEDDDTDGWGDGIEKQDSIPEAEPLPMEKQISAVVKLSREDIKQHIDKKIKTLSETVELNDEKCLLLLRKHKWNEANIIELYFSNPEATQIDAGICINPLSQEGINKKIDESKVIECGVCLEDDININDTYYLQCGHISTCKSCWIHYLLTSTKTTDCINLTCPTHKCKLIIQSHIYKMFLADKYTDAFKRYLRFCDENFVENSKEFVFCPGKSCDMIYSAEVGIAKEICCSECSYRFCYACKYDSHLPASCDVAEMWLNKCSSEANYFVGIS
eukprot:396516_1